MDSVDRIFRIQTRRERKVERKKRDICTNSSYCFRVKRVPKFQYEEYENHGPTANFNIIVKGPERWLDG